MLEGDMIAVRLSEPFRFVAVGTPEYFERFGRPKSPSDLALHRCIRLRLASSGMLPWTFQMGNREEEMQITGPVIVNDISAMTVAVRSGVAIGMIAEPIIADDVAAGRMEIVLDEFAATTAGLFLYYPSRKQVMPKLRAFIDYARDHLPAHLRS